VRLVVRLTATLEQLITHQNPVIFKESGRNQKVVHYLARNHPYYSTPAFNRTESHYLLEFELFYNLLGPMGATRSREMSTRIIGERGNEKRRLREVRGAKEGC
jgi:hypothetical protein